MSREYEINLTSSARKEIRNLEKPVASRVAAAIDALIAAPHPPGCRKLEGEDDSWRVRVGDYRIIYTIDDRAAAIWIIAVRHRSDAYR
jgi:mRNA interferase RelE/StbE